MGSIACQLRYIEALRYFLDLFCEIKTVTVCANLGSLDRGKWFHGYIDTSRGLQSSNTMTALIDMYANCGTIDCAYRAFDTKRDN